MVTLNILLITFVILAKDIGISHSLVQGGKNVCSKQSLVKVVDVYPTTWSEDWDCEASYPTSTCERIRSNEIDINSVYFIKEDLTCCPGWLTSEDDEAECSQSCPNGYFGENCMYECRCINGRNPSQCKAEDGSCDCLDGWTGRECNKRCRPGFFGPNCLSRSIFICMNGGVNHPVTGHCLCRSGYDGSRCEIRCGGIEDLDCGHIVCENCIPNRTERCDISSRTCRCRNGWKGRYCTVPCEIGSTGEFCAKTCCSGRGYCTGESCICADGYHGDQCQHKCEDGTFGRSCQRICECPSCNHATGDCDVCPYGFTGDRCTESCLPKQWGQSCNSTCSCEKNEACDVFMGECPSSGSLVWLLALVFVVILILVGAGCLCFVCNRSSKKVQNEDEQNAAQNDNYSTINGNGYTWSGGPYMAVRDNSTPNGQPGVPGQPVEGVYNPAYQSFKDRTSTDIGEGVYNSVDPSAKDHPKANNSIKTHFNNPVYNIEVPETKENVIAQVEEHHPYEDLSHNYDNAIFSKKP